MSSTNQPAIDKAPFDELEALASKLERLVLMKRLVDMESGEEGAGLVYLTGRELELIVEAVAAAAAKAFMESR